MKITRILLKGGQQHVDFKRSDGAQVETKAFPATTSRKKIDEALNKLPVKPEAPAPKKSNT